MVFLTLVFYTSFSLFLGTLEGIFWVFWVLSGMYFLGEKSQVAEGHKLLRGVRGHAPLNFFKWICAEMQSGAYWDTILRNVPGCALTSLRLDDFSDSYLYTVLITTFLGGKLGILGAKLLPLKYPRYNPANPLSPQPAPTPTEKGSVRYF